MGLASGTSRRMMATTGGVTCTSDGDGAVLAWDWEYQLQGALPVGGPVFALFAGRWERRTWLRLRDLLETRPPG